MSRKYTEEEDRQIIEFLVEKTKNDDFKPTSAAKIWAEFREITTIANKTIRTLFCHFKDFLSKDLQRMENIEMDTVAHILFMMNTPVEAEFLKKIKKSGARIQLDKTSAIARYQNGELQLTGLDEKGERLEPFPEKRGKRKRDGEKEIGGNVKRRSGRLNEKEQGGAPENAPESAPEGPEAQNLMDMDTLEHSEPETRPEMVQNDPETHPEEPIITSEEQEDAPSAQEPEIRRSDEPEVAQKEPDTHSVSPKSNGKEPGAPESKSPAQTGNAPIQNTPKQPEAHPDTQKRLSEEHGAPELAPSDPIAPEEPEAAHPEAQKTIGAEPRAQNAPKESDTLPETQQRLSEEPGAPNPKSPIQNAQNHPETRPDTQNRAQETRYPISSAPNAQNQKSPMQNAQNHPETHPETQQRRSEEPGAPELAPIAPNPNSPIQKAQNHPETHADTPQRLSEEPGAPILAPNSMAQNNPEAHPDTPQRLSEEPRAPELVPNAPKHPEDQRRAPELAPTQRNQAPELAPPTRYPIHLPGAQMLRSLYDAQNRAQRAHNQNQEQRVRRKSRTRLHLPNLNFIKRQFRPDTPFQNPNEQLGDPSYLRNYGFPPTGSIHYGEIFQYLKYWVLSVNAIEYSKNLEELGVKIEQGIMEYDERNQPQRCNIGELEKALRMILIKVVKNSHAPELYNDNQEDHYLYSKYFFKMFFFTICVMDIPEFTDLRKEIDFECEEARRLNKKISMNKLHSYLEDSYRLFFAC